MRLLFLIIFTLFFISESVFASSVMLEDLTWPEVRDALKTGKTTAIIPTGGTEQTGPYIVLGKHNFILRITAKAIAERLGNALVTPILAYVPEGTIHPPTGHMQFAGTLSLSPETFAAVLEDTARSLKEHGFKIICLVGEHGASQDVQMQVAEKLSKEWQAENVRVMQVNEYYDEHNGQVAWAEKYYPQEKDIEAHGGFADTSEMLAAWPEGIHTTKDPIFKGTDAKWGIGGSTENASKVAGEHLLELKIQSAVNQIKKQTAPSNLTK
jgi:creatinine amidohydrolase